MDSVLGSPPHARIVRAVVLPTHVCVSWANRRRRGGHTSTGPRRRAFAESNLHLVKTAPSPLGATSAPWSLSGPSGDPSRVSRPSPAHAASAAPTRPAHAAPEPARPRAAPLSAARTPDSDSADHAHQVRGRRGLSGLQGPHRGGWAQPEAQRHRWLRHRTRTLSALRLPSVADRPDVPGSLLSVGANGSGKSNFFAGACRAHAEAAACVARRPATPERAAAAAEPERACVCAPRSD